MKDLLARMAQCVVLGVGASLAAQVESDEGACPHQSVERVMPAVLTGNSVACGSGVQWNFGSFQYTSPQNTCTLLLTYTPEHDITKSTPGSNTYTEPTQWVATYIGRYQCRTSHFLFIPIGSTCEEVSFMEANRIPNYLQRRCRN